jgi:murein L,D-transpeptidase YafK
LRRIPPTAAAPIVLVLLLTGVVAGAPNDAAAQRLLVREFLPIPTAVADNGAAHFGAAELFESDFLTAQLRHPRVLSARIESRFAIKQMFDERGISYPAAEIFLRVFKRERVLELWARPQGETEFRHLKTYAVCALAGEPGPKRRQGDNQTPEGFYHIDHFNPNSSWHLSLHVNYPNRSDRILGGAGPLGGDIYIHGGCRTEGCIAITDEGIKELYWIGVEARAAGQRTIPVHIFPFRLDEENLRIAAGVFAESPALVRFWESLVPGYAHFETTRTLPAMGVDTQGFYALQGAAAPTSVGAGPALLGRPAGGQ